MQAKPCILLILYIYIARNLSLHRPNTNHLDSLHTSDGAFDMLALMSHRRVVCRGNLVFCLIGEKKYSNFIIGRQRKNTPYPVHRKGQFQTEHAWLADLASLPTK